MKNDFLIALTAAAAMYLVSAVFWITPWPYQALGRVSDDRAAGDALLQSFSEAGVYMLPDLREKPEELPRLYEAGPIATIFIATGQPMLSWSRHFMGLFTFFLVGYVLSHLTKRISLSLVRVRHQVGVPAIIGIAAALLCDATEPIWFYQDVTWHAVLGLHHWITWSVGSWTVIALLKGRDSFLFRTIAYLQTSSRRSSSLRPSTTI